MNYLSTRGDRTPRGFSDILLEGLAPDGGLYLPERYPRVNAATLARWRALPYAELAFEILSLYIDDIPAADLRELVAKTYTEQVFGSKQIVPLRALEPGVYLEALSNGPTLAFKDMAMQLLGNLFEYELARRGQTLNILGATSGDTGSAAEYAMRGKQGVGVFMLSPHGRMSPFQQAQMYALADPNIHNIAIEGAFDDCQDIVKAVNADAPFKTRWKIGAVNSINWARVAAQTVYYFKAYFAATKGAGEEIAFAVPSGNFGNIFAAHVAREMGVPIGQLILATNENDVLDEFFRTLVYRPRGTAETQATSSPSMDISKASNFERYVFDIVDREAGVVRALWKDLRERGAFDLSPFEARIRASVFVSGRSTHADRVATIRDVDRRYGLTIDPHTADGLKVGRELRRPDLPLVCIETALPAKFSSTIKEALGREPERPAAYAGLEARPQRVTVLPADAARVKAFIAAHAAA